MARRGYDQAQVDNHLRRLDAEVRMLAADRDAAVAQNARLGRELDDARSRGEALHQQVNRLAGPPQNVQGMSERLRSMLRLAEDEVAEMHTRAESEIAEQRHQGEEHARRIVADARAEAQRLVADAEAEAERSASAADTERAALAELRERTERELAEQRERTERETTERRETLEREVAQRESESARKIREADSTADAERARRDTESEQARTTVQRDFAIAMDQRRREALGTLITERDALAEENARARRTAGQQAERLRSEAEEYARRTREEAERTAAQLVEDAEHRLEELTGLHTQVTDQLRRARATLDTELGLLETEASGTPEPRKAGAEPSEQADNPVDGPVPAQDGSPARPPSNGATRTTAHVGG